jgi:hypothetical protein
MLLQNILSKSCHIESTLLVLDFDLPMTLVWGLICRNKLIRVV